MHIWTWLEKVTVRAGGKLWQNITIGYEDEHGFHYGPCPDGDELWKTTDHVAGYCEHPGGG